MAMSYTRYGPSNNRGSSSGAKEMQWLYSIRQYSDYQRLRPPPKEAG